MLDIRWMEMRRPEAYQKEPWNFVFKKLTRLLEEATRLGGWILPNVGFGAGEGVVRSYTEAVPAQV